jgi:aconitase A
MYILDTDHLSILDRGGAGAQRLLLRLANVNPSEIVATIISYEEQTRGWLSYVTKARTVEGQVQAYKQLKQQLTNSNSDTQQFRCVILRLTHLTIKLSSPKTRQLFTSLSIVGVNCTHQTRIKRSRYVSNFHRIARIVNWCPN